MKGSRIPPDFRYFETLSRGRPIHDPYDDFSLRHPSMPLGRRAKIFSPFDALKGFNEAIAAKDVRYVPRKHLSPEETEDLDRKVSLLHSLVTDSHAADRLQIRVSAEYFVPCKDPESAAFGTRGTYHRVSGICREVSFHKRCILIGHHRLSFKDIASLEICTDTSADQTK